MAPDRNGQAHDQAELGNIVNMRVNTEPSMAL